MKEKRRAEAEGGGRSQKFENCKVMYLYTVHVFCFSFTELKVVNLLSYPKTQRLRNISKQKEPSYTIFEQTVCQSVILEE